MPCSSSSWAMRGVIPKPEAEFSPLAMTRSMALFDKVGEPVVDDLAAGRTDDVADEQNLHAEAALSTFRGNIKPTAARERRESHQKQNGADCLAVGS